MRLGSQIQLSKTTPTLALCLLASSPDNLCKQLGPRSGPLFSRAWSESQPQNPEFRNNPENFLPCKRDTSSEILLMDTFCNWVQMLSITALWDLGMLDSGGHVYIFLSHLRLHY